MAPQARAPVASATPSQSLAMMVPPVSPSPAPPAPAGGEHYFQDCAGCLWMVRIEGASFLMGQGAKDTSALPAHRVMIKPFALSQYPVTVADWNACHTDGGCGAAPRMAATEASTPVHNLSWDDAQTYVVWLSRRAGHLYRLPTEAEWEYAARAGTTTRYWWGDQPGVALANCAGCGGQQDPKAPLPADAFQPNAFGLYGMLGGVSQWMQDCWFPNYNGAPADGSARDARGCSKRVLRGGSFRSSADEITPVSRSNYDAPVRYLANGFRVARSLE